MPPASQNSTSRKQVDIDGHLQNGSFFEKDTSEKEPNTEKIVPTASKSDGSGSQCQATVKEMGWGAALIKEHLLPIEWGNWHICPAGFQNSYEPVTRFWREMPLTAHVASIKHGMAWYGIVHLYHMVIRSVCGGGHISCPSSLVFGYRLFISEEMLRSWTLMWCPNHVSLLRDLRQGTYFAYESKCKLLQPESTGKLQKNIHNAL